MYFLMNSVKYLGVAKLNSFCLRNLSTLANKSVSNFVIEEPVTVDNQFECLAKVATPLYEVPYGKQLKIKEQWTAKIVKSIFGKKKSSECEKSSIIPSPVTEHYRNKDEFCVRTGADGNPKTVGLFVGSPAKGDVVCVPPKLVNTKLNHVAVAQTFQSFIENSPLAACHLFGDGGYWKNLIVRSNREGETMAIVVAHPLEQCQETKEEMVDNLTNHFQKADCRVDSLYLQECPHTRCSNSQAPFSLLYGPANIFETLNDCKFRISPDSFFQINTEAAEQMYSVVISLLELSRYTTLLDLCCGTGTISILSSKECLGAVGIEVIEDAVADASFNASNNQLTNCMFLFGRVEKKLKLVLKQLEMSSDLAVVLNPGRGGVNEDVIQKIRDHHTITRLVYISCKADSPQTSKNLKHLVDKSLPGTPFHLTLVQPVDLFPHTHHCELVFLYQR